MIVEERWCGDVPLLLVRSESLTLPAPAVLWFHGFGVDASTHLKELHQLAHAGFLAIGVDAAGHGKRRLPDLQQRIDAPQAEALLTAVSLAAETAAEMPGLLRRLSADGLLDAARVAIAGISMGGFVAYRTIVETPGLRCAVVILGSPEWPHPLSPHHHLDALATTALLSITAEHDENVPPDAARRLHLRLDAERPAAVHRYVELAGAVHLMAAADWDRTMSLTLDWLTRWTLP